MSLRTLGIIMFVVMVIVLACTNPDFQEGFRQGWND